MPYKDKSKQKKYQREWYRNNKDRISRRRETQAQRSVRKLSEYKDTISCSVCGYNRCPQALDFHHKEPEEKAFRISRARDYSWEAVVEEIGKCVVLCRNCHQEYHYGIIDI